MIIKSLSVWKDGRNYLNGEPLAHFVWNHYNPDNLYRKGYNVHHKDGNILNDHISNLELLTIEEHTSFHHKGKYGPWNGKKHSEETKKKMSLAKKGIKFSKERNEKLSKLLKGHIVSEETRSKISKTLKGHIVTEETRKKMSKPRKAYNDWKTNESYKKGAYHD